MSKRVRVREPKREGNLHNVAEQALGETHLVKLIWRVVEQLDDSPLLAGFKAVDGHPGPDVKSRRLLVAMWLYGLALGLTCARQIERQARTDLAFLWLQGDLRIRHQRLSEFRRDHSDALNRVFVEHVQALVGAGRADPSTVANDGTRVQANASSSSFRTAASLARRLEQAQLHLHAVTNEADADDPQHPMRVGKARAAQARVEQAIGVVEKVRSGHHNSKDKDRQTSEPKASVSDPDARMMLIPQAGKRPGYNVQLSVCADPVSGPRTILAVDVTNVGSDMGSITPMRRAVEANTGTRPTTVYADSDHGALACIRQAARDGCTLVIPEKNMRKPRKTQDATKKNPARRLRGRTRPSTRGECA